MKYLVVVESSEDKGAVIFDSLHEAKKYLKYLTTYFDKTITVKWNGNEKFEATSNNGKIKVRIVSASHAEYRLLRHKAGEKDEERRFSLRKNAINFVRNIDSNISRESIKKGNWLDEPVNGYQYKLYAVILDDANIIKRFNAITSEYFLEQEFGINTDIDEQNEKKVNTAINKKKPKIKELNIFKGPNKKKQIFTTILSVFLIAVIIGMACTDWQLLEDERKASNFNASEAVVSIGNDLHLTRKGTAVFYASQPRLVNSAEFNKICGRDGDGTFTSGCYYRDDYDDEHIEIYNIGTSTIIENGVSYNFSSDLKITTLHEMLHAVWARFSDNKQMAVCGDLKVLSNQIDELESEINLYSESKKCTELFARVGSEYIQFLSPDYHKTASSVPIQYSSLNSNGKTVADNLSKIYGEYFDTSKTYNVEAYWNNQKELEDFEEEISNFSKQLKIEETYVQTLIDGYYRWPNWHNYNLANDAIDEYNEMVNLYNSYINTYNKIYVRLDSEKTMVGESVLGI